MTLQVISGFVIAVICLSQGLWILAVRPESDRAIAKTRRIRQPLAIVLINVGVLMMSLSVSRI